MNTAELQKEATVALVMWYQKAQKMFGNIGPCPDVKINRRFTSMAGRASLNDNLIELSEYLYLRNRQEFLKNTIPHELAHFIAYRKYKDRGHGKAWKEVAMYLYGDNSRCHKMETKSEAMKKNAKS